MFTCQELVPVQGLADRQAATTVVHACPAGIGRACRVRAGAPGVVVRPDSRSPAGPLARADSMWAICSGRPA